jgi:uncharacterized protein (TIGR00369 family)
MESMVRGETAMPAAAALIGMRLESFATGEALVALDATAAHANPMTTLEVKINFLRPVWAGRLEARGRVKSFGRNVSLVECDVTSGGKLVAHGVSTCMTLRGEQAAGR